MIAGGARKILEMLGFDNMNSFLSFFVFCLFIILSAPATCFGADDLVGEWQFEDKGVFVAIYDDNKAFQCRVLATGVVATSHGKLENEKTIIWEPIKVTTAKGQIADFMVQGIDWGRDEVMLNDSDHITLVGPYGDYKFRRIDNEFIDACLGIVQKYRSDKNQE